MERMLSRLAKETVIVTVSVLQATSVSNEVASLLSLVALGKERKTGTTVCLLSNKLAVCTGLTGAWIRRHAITMPKPLETLDVSSG
jgi:hypothetical protein